MGELPPDYDVRLARTDEIESIRAIEIAAAKVIPAEDLPPEMGQGALPFDLLERAVSEGRLFVAINLSEHCPVGFALATVVDDSGHLFELDVLPSHGRRGVGAALIAAVVAWAKQRGFPSVTLTTFRHLPFNAPFYERLGFQGLPENGLPGPLVELLEKEEANGLDRSTRLAMRLDLAPK